MLVKDFYATEPYSENSAFMTNADAPAIAVEGILPLHDTAFMPKKQNGVIIATVRKPYDQSNTYLRVRENIFDADNWEKIEEIN
jgi:hypothetical protein